MSTTIDMTLIKNGKLKATDIGEGETLTGVLVGFKENQYGKQNALITVDNQTVELMIAGNLRFLADDVNKGKFSLYKSITITRVEDKDINGYATSQFKLTQEGAPQKAAVSGVSSTTGSTVNPDVKAKLAAIQAKRGGASGANA
jgi:hypothetical protein